MNHAALNRFIIILSTALVGLTFLLNRPESTILTAYSGQALIYLILTTLTLYFGVRLTRRQFSPAHIVSITAFLALPPEAQPLLVWSVSLGALLGAWIRTTRNDPPGSISAFIRFGKIIVITARFCLSLYIAGFFYRMVNGQLPLIPPLREQFIPLAVFSLLYIIIYLFFFFIDTYIDGRQPFRLLKENTLLIAAILLVPVPFGILAAVVISQSPSAIAFFGIGVTLAALGLHRFSEAQHQLRKQLDEVQSLTAVSQALQSDLKLNSLLYAVYNQVAQLMHTDLFLVALYDRLSQNLTFPLVMRGGFQLGDYHESADQTLLGRVLQQQHPLLITHDVTRRAHHLRLKAPAENTQSWLGVPLLSGGRLLGAIVVTSTDPRYLFNSGDESLLTIVATSASIAIENAQLYESQTARANQLAALNDALSRLNGTLSPEDVMRAIVQSAVRIAEATSAALYLYWDEQKSTLALIQSDGLSAAFNTDPLMPLITDEQDKPLLIPNIAQDTRAIPYRALLEREGKAAWAEVPLIVDDEPLGVICFFYDHPQHFHSDDVEILRAFTNHAAQAIINARKYTLTDQALGRQVEQMYALAMLGRQVTATMEVDTICNLVLNRALDLRQPAAGFILLKSESGVYQTAAQEGYPATITITPEVVLQTLSAAVLTSAQPLRVEDTLIHTGQSPLMLTSRSQLTVPLLAGLEVTGVITLESEEPVFFTEEDSYYLTQLANQLMIAIENKRLFQRISETRDRLQLILDTMSEGIVLIDEHGVVALANPRVALIGLSPEQLLGQSVESLLAQPDLQLSSRMGFQNPDSFRKLLRQPAGLNGSAPVSYTVEIHAVARHVERFIIPLESPTGDPVGWLLVFYDETEARELLDMRADLSNMIVHDLRSPLTAVTTGLKLMREIVPADAPFRPMVISTVETSQRAIRKMLIRVDSLLDISQMDSGQLVLETQPTDLATIADSVCVELSPLAQELDVTLTTSIDDETPAVDADPDKLERILQNLVDNALKFCPAGGQVIIRARPPAARESGRRQVRIDVIDTGPGIPDEYKTRLFDRFVQMRERRGARRGSGLGLTFCKMVVEAHGGKIWIEDNPTGGSIFAFTLPVADLPADPDIG